MSTAIDRAVGIDGAVSVVDLFRRRVAERGTATAVTVVADVRQPETAHAVSYAEVDRQARAVARRLRDRYATGDRVMLLYPSGTDFVAAFLGVLYAGMVAVPAPLPGQYPHQRRRVRGIVADAGVCAVLTGTGDAAAVRDWAAQQQLSDVDILETGADPTGADPTGDGTGDVDGDGDGWTVPEPGRHDLAMLQYTSGSTGAPKGVMVSHGNLLHNVASLARTMGFTAGTRFGGWIPLYHDMGLIGQLLPALFLGSECVLMAPTGFLRRPAHWLDLIDTFDVHYSAAPNFAYEQCVHALTDEQIASLDLSRWQYAANGSEPVRAATLAAFAQRLAPAGFRAQALAPCYGLAEATVYVSGRAGRAPATIRIDAQELERHAFVPVADGGVELVGCGTPHGFDVLVVDPATGRPALPGRIGEIWLRGDSVTQGYWRSPHATVETFRARTADGDGDGGYLRTGDLGVYQAGELYITGRLKEMLIVRGRNLYPQDIEYEIRAQHPELRAGVGAVFGVQVPGEEIVVTHEVRGRPDAERLRELSAAIRLTVVREFGVRPAGVVLLRPGAVRRTTSGKIQRGAMRELFLSGELAEVHAALDPALVAARDRRQETAADE